MITVNIEVFGKLDEKEVLKYTLITDKGFQVSVINYGATIVEILAKDKNGLRKNVVLGYDCFNKYIKNPSYAGAFVGRTAGRTKNAKYFINDKEYNLEKNNGENSIHGGIDGLSHKLFEVQILENGIKMTYTSKDGENGYNGNVDFTVIYTISSNGEKDVLYTEYRAKSDQDTYVNVTNHSYFNLSGDLTKCGEEQFLTIDSCGYLVLEEDMIPTGEIKKFVELSNSDHDVEIFDFRKEKQIKKGIEKGQSEQHPQFLITRAYDHPYVLNNNFSVSSIENQYKKANVSLRCSFSGRKMNIYTTEKCAVVYTGNYLDDVERFDSKNNDKVNNDSKKQRYLGVAIETQNFPNYMNTDKGKNEILKKDEIYLSKTIYEFEVYK